MEPSDNEFFAALVGQINRAMGPPSNTWTDASGLITEAIWSNGDVEVSAWAHRTHITVSVRQWSPLHARWFGVSGSLWPSANIPASLAYHTNRLRRDLLAAMEDVQVRR